MMTKEKKIELLKVLAVFALCALIALALVNVWAWLMFGGQAINRINFINWAARDIGDTVEYNAELLELPKKGEMQLSGGADRYGNFTIAAYPESGGCVYLLHHGEHEITQYWTAQIKDGKVQEIWLAYHPLTEAEMHPYDYEMQRAVIRFVILPLPHSWVDDRELIGYWKAPAEQEEAA